jgi:TfuA protein
MPVHDVVFVGPSISPALVRSVFPGVVQPPIRRGQLDDLIHSAEPPSAVGIVDGRFLQDLAVSPKEVLRALDSGMAVFGASSIGALRAVECAPYGAIGIGRIYEMFASGELEADDEVALTYDSDTLRATSEPLVNIRVAMEYAVSNGVLSAAAAELVVGTAKGLYFPDRSYPNVARLLAGRLPGPELEAYSRFVRSPECPDQKRDDALAMLRAMTRTQAEGVEVRVSA